MIEGLKNLSYKERLREVKITTLETRRIGADMVEVYKIVKGLEGLKIEEFFDLIKASNTRSHPYKMYKKGFKLNNGKFSFGNRVVNEWNALTEFVVSAPSINEFKKRLDYHL